MKKCEIFDFIHIWVDIVAKLSNTSEIYNILNAEYDPVRARNPEIHPGEENLQITLAEIICLIIDSRSRH